MRNEGLTPLSSTTHTLTGDPYKHAVAADAAGQTLLFRYWPLSPLLPSSLLHHVQSAPESAELPHNALSYRATYCILQCPASIS